jgi:DNA invertase Pin-like site-specific DNA recombinase
MNSGDFGNARVFFLDGRRSITVRCGEQSRRAEVTTMIRAAIYARVSTADQTTDNQLLALRSFSGARGWNTTEYTDTGVSGVKDQRPALDAMLRAARTRKIDVITVTKLDRLARSTHQLVSLGRELQALGVDLVVLDQSIDTTTPSGRLLFHVLAAIAEFERDLIRDRVVAGMKRARAQGRRIGRPRVHRVDAEQAGELLASGLGLRAVARQLGVHPSAVSRAVANAARRGALVTA